MSSSNKQAPSHLYKLTMKYWRQNIKKNPTVPFIIESSPHLTKYVPGLHCEKPHPMTWVKLSCIMLSEGVSKDYRLYYMIFINLHAYDIVEMTKVS